MPDGLYDRDILSWSEHQATLLRRLAAGERVNGELDWENLIDEVEAVGRSELRACESLLLQALLHLLKMQAWPESQAVKHWRAETVGFLLDAQRAFSPSMRSRVDLGDLHRNALDRLASTTDDTGEPGPVPDQCPYELAALLAKPDIPALLAQLKTQPPPAP